MQWPLLADVPAVHLHQVLSIARRRTFGRNEVVFHRGDPGDTVLIAVYGVGDSFGELALVGGGAPRSATVGALEPSETWTIVRDDFTRLLERYPGVNSVLVAILADQVRRSNERVIEAYHVDADRRVRRRLLELARLYPDGTIPLTQEDVAGMAGTSRATVNRVLSADAKRGIVELGRGRTVVLKPEELERRAR